MSLQPSLSISSPSLSAHSDPVCPACVELLPSSADVRCRARMRGSRSLFLSGCRWPVSRCGCQPGAAAAAVTGSSGCVGQNIYKQRVDVPRLDPVCTLSELSLPISVYRPWRRRTGRLGSIGCGLDVCSSALLPALVAAGAPGSAVV